MNKLYIFSATCELMERADNKVFSPDFIRTEQCFDNKSRVIALTNILLANPRLILVLCITPENIEDHGEDFFNIGIFLIYLIKYFNFLFFFYLPRFISTVTASRKIPLLRDDAFCGKKRYSQFLFFFSSWQLGAERQTCHVTLIVPRVMN